MRNYDEIKDELREVVEKDILNVAIEINSYNGKYDEVNYHSFEEMAEQLGLMSWGELLSTVM